MLLKAYAKINLILKVTNKLPNNYHNLQMINTLIDIYDEIDITVNNKDKDTLIFKNTHLTNEDNLIINVLNEIKDVYNIRENFDIIVTKNIPVGAGMGGGSSDVASIILYLCDTYNIKKDDKLFNILNKYGKDIMYFIYTNIYNNTLYLEGTGDIVYNKSINYQDEVVIVYPNMIINTKDVFNNNDIYTNYINKDKLINLVKNKEYNMYSNDLEEAAFKTNNNLYNIKKELTSIATCHMSGSGSTFILYGKDIEDIYNKCINKYPTYYIKKVKVL